MPGFVWRLHAQRTPRKSKERTKEVALHNLLVLFRDLTLNKATHFILRSMMLTTILILQ